MRLRIPRWLILLCLLAATTGCDMFAAVSRHGTIDHESHSVAISSWVEPDGALPDIEHVASLAPDQWRQGAKAQTHGYSAAAVWFRLALTIPADAHGEWVLEFRAPLLDRLDVYLPHPEGWELVAMGDHLPFDLRPLPTRNFALPLEWSGGSEIVLLARVESGTSIFLPTRLLTRQALFDSDRRELVINAAYLGVMAGLLLYNLLLIYRVRETLYFYYAGWLFMITLFVLGLDGLNYQYLWPNSIWWNDLSIMLSLLLSSFLLAGFWFRTLSEYIRHPAIPSDRIWLLTMLATAVAASLLPYRIAIQLTILFALLCVLMQILLALRAGRVGFSGAHGLLGSFIPLVIAGYVLAMQRLGLIDYNPVSQYAIALGSALQAIMLSALLGDRLSRLRELNAAALEMQRFNRSLGESNAALEASNCALREALQLSEARALAITEMKETLRLAAEERNSEKSKFLAQAVHDLKQPLQAISIAVTPIQSLLGEHANPQVTELIDVVRRASLIMRNQISGLLDLSRLESGFIRPQIEVFALQPFISPLIDPLETYGRDRGVRIELAKDDGLATHVRSDQNLLRQILINLISNAIKYADPGKAPDCLVKVSWAHRSGQVAITIEDNGIGIEAGHLAGRRIFQPFFQAHNSLPEGEKGVGLGLSIVNAALALMPDHRITVESQFGSGSRFTVFAPLAECVETPAEIRPARSEDNPTGLAGKYVVLVDDDTLIRRSIVGLLDHHGVLHDEFDSVADLADNLRILERRPDVLLSDYRLPDNKTALDVIALMTEIWPGVPTVVVTGDAEAAATLAGRNDVSGVMHKPVSTVELLNRLANACALPETEAWEDSGPHAP